MEPRLLALGSLTAARGESQLIQLGVMGNGDGLHLKWRSQRGFLVFSVG